MKTVVAAALAFIALVAGAGAEESAKIEIAVVHIDAIMQNSNFNQRIGLRALDKDALAAMRKIVAESKAVRLEIADAKDQAELKDLQNKLQILNQKLRLVMRKKANVRRDTQALLRDFLVANYKDRYSLILQPNVGGNDPILWRGGVEITDITEEATEKLRAYLDEISGGANMEAPISSSLRSYSTPATTGPLAEPAAGTEPGAGPIPIAPPKSSN